MRGFEIVRETQISIRCDFLFEARIGKSKSMVDRVKATLGASITCAQCHYLETYSDFSDLWAVYLLTLLLLA